MTRRPPLPAPHRSAARRRHADPVPIGSPANALHEVKVTIACSVCGYADELSSHYTSEHVLDSIEMEIIVKSLLATAEAQGWTWPRARKAHCPKCTAKTEPS